MNKETLIELLKNKIIITRGFKHEDRKRAFAEIFLDEHLSKINPDYYDFIYKYFDRDNVLLRLKNIAGGKIISHYDKTVDTLYQEIQFAESDYSYFNLCHELGHAANQFIFRSSADCNFDFELTSAHLGSDSLEITLNKEIERCAKPLINKILKEYKMMLQNEFRFDILTRYFDNYDLYMEKEDLYRKLGGRRHFIDPNISDKARAAAKNGTFYPDLKRYQEIEKILESRQATNLDLMLKGSHSRRNILQIYTEPLCEALIPFYDAKKYKLHCHGLSYMDNKGMYAEELFANFFAYKLTNDNESLYTLKTFLPKTYKKCNLIFNFIGQYYDFSKAPEYKMDLLMQNSFDYLDKGGKDE